MEQQTTSPKIIQFVTQAAVENVGLRDISDPDTSPHVAHAYCDECERVTYAHMFDVTRAPDGGFPPESQDAFKALVDNHRAAGWRHVISYYGMLKQCAACAARESV